MKKLLFCIFLLFSIILHPAMDPNLVKKFKQQESDQRSKYVPYTQNRVHRAGSLWMNISNCGWFGVWEELNDPCTGKPAPRGEMPGGSGQEYLFNSSIWFGGYLNSGTNQNGATIFEGPRVSTAADGTSLYSNELKPYYFDEDVRGLTLGRIIETSSIEGRMNCLFEEVYDPKATAYEQFTTRYTDKGTDHFTWDWFDGSTHSPLGVEVKQVTYAWPYDYAKKFIIVDYTIYNKNSDKKDIYDFFVGIYVDTDVFKINEDGYGFWDDICGFIEKWDGYIDPATGEKKSVDMNLVWSADNDGRNYISRDEWYMDYEPGAQGPLDGSTGVFSIRVLRNPNPSLRYSFNLSSTDFNSESLDWGPRWKTGLHSDWQFDLTPAQKGYDDTNYDNLLWYVGEPLYGGRTEGTPLGEIGKYMVMSNDEFDYNLTSIREVHLGMDTQADGTPIPQADKWQRWTTETDIGNEGFSEDIADGTIKNMNDIANGYEQRFILSFGPLGYETYENVAVDADHDSLGIPESFINKKVWKFAYGDSLKLTLAYMVSENFHTSLDQDPNYVDSAVVDLSDGLDITLYDQG